METCGRRRGERGGGAGTGREGGSGVRRKGAAGGRLGRCVGRCGGCQEGCGAGGLQDGGDTAPGGARGCQGPHPGRLPTPGTGCHLPRAAPPRVWGAPGLPDGMGRGGGWGGVDLGPNRSWKVYPRISPAEFISAISVKSLCGGIRNQSFKNRRKAPEKPLPPPPPSAQPHPCG